MKTRHARMKLVALLIALIALAAIWAGWGAGRVAAIEDSEEMPPPFGLAMGQTARLSILNSSTESGIIIIGGKFLDSAGRTLAQPVGRGLISPGQFMSFDLDGDSLDVTRDRFGRIQLRAVVTALGGPSTRNLDVSLEVFDNVTGKTTAFIADIKGFSPPPDGD